MSPGAELIDDGLRALEEVQGHPTFVYNHRHWACCYGEDVQESTLIPGGWESDMEMMMTVRFTAITPIRTADQNEEPDDGGGDTDTADHHVMPPREGRVITAIRDNRMRQWKIARVTANTACWRCRLVSVDK